MAYRFFSTPLHLLEHPLEALSKAERLQAPTTLHRDIIEKAFLGVEYRNTPASRILKALWAPSDVELQRSMVFARPPDDLPALLRLAGALEDAMRQEGTEKALVWKCECGTRYAVPMALVRSVAIVCERCRGTVQLMPGASLGEEALLDPFQGAVNTCRKQLAEFFRESMARGWPVRLSVMAVPNESAVR